MSKRLISGAEIIYHSLVRNNVKNIFGYSGGSVMPIVDTLHYSNQQKFNENNFINFYVNSNEQNVGLAATGYAKMSGKTGVALVTSGPGITNILTPMLDATNDSTPLLVISGQVSKEAVGTNAFQEAPAVELSKNVTKWSYQPEDIYELSEVIDEAFYIANNKKKGTVHLDIPKCVSSKHVFYDVYYNSMSYINNLHKSYFSSSFTNLKRKKNNSDINEAIDKINKSKKPILMIGQGCINYSKKLTDFVNKTNIPVTTTIHGCGILDEHHDLSLRWCGMHGYAPANYALQEADCIIALGSRFDDRTTGLVSKYAPNAVKNKAIIHVNIEEDEINKVVNSHYNFVMDCGDFLQETYDRIKFNKRNDWFIQLNGWKNNYKFRFPEKSKSKLNMENVLDSLYRNTLEKDVLFTTGVGNHQMQAYQFIKSQYPKKIISSGSLGVMGASLPYSIGAQISNKDKLVICIDGDSSFNMTCTDMKTIKELDLPIKIAIMNNNAQMMVTIWERLYFEERYTATINNNNPDFTKLAEAYGIESIYCDSYDDLEDKVKEFINQDGPILCEFNIERDICLPLVGPGKSLDDMILPEEYNYKTSKDLVFKGSVPS